MNKKIVAIILVLSMAASLIACGNNEKTPVPTSSPTPTESAPTAEPADPTPTATPTETPTPTPVVGVVHDATYTTTYNVPKGTFCEPETLTTRAFIAITTGDGVLLSWRSFGEANESFTLKKNGNVIYSGNLTNYLDKGAKADGSAYTLSYIEGGILKEEKAVAAASEYHEFALNMPPDTFLPNNHHAKHEANDMSVGDLDGDGDLELIVKWYPDDAKDNSQDGWTGTLILDGYDLDFNTCTATLLWRIDLGITVRSGAHYTQFQVWDYDGDGIAEIICQTADGTTTYNAKLEETGHVGAVSMSQLDPHLTKKQQEYDYRLTAEGAGKVLSGPEYLTCFNGLTGEIIDSVPYVPERGPVDAKGNVDMNSWGDNYGNRCDRFLAGTAYIDDGAPAAIFCRGYYARTTLTAWKLIDKKLTLSWYFDTPRGTPYAGQGNHQLAINDVDGDGFDEIIYGALVIDNDGSVLNLTGLCHGDSMHVSDLNGDGKLDVFSCHEVAGVEYQIELHDAATAEIIWGVHTGKDTGRALAADIDPRYPGAEMWAAANGNTFDCNGNVIYNNKKPSVNFCIYWDGDLLQELFDYNNQQEYTPEVQKWDYEKQKAVVLLSAKGTAVSNGTKGNAGLVADIAGDWREEVIVRCTGDPSKIRVYSTPYTTEYVIPCLLTDRAYREGIAWQNTAYNQPAHLAKPIEAYIVK